MKFDFRKGNKGDSDLILYIYTEGYEQITFKDLLTIIKFFFDNEDRIYPPPAKGSLFLLNAIQDLQNMTVDKILLKYQLKPADKIADFL